MEEDEESCVHDRDRLSDLPEPLLTSILSTIPTKQAVATSVLSKRWRYLWHSITHLQLLHENLFPTSDDDDRSAIEVWESMLNSIELSVRGPVQSCRISFNPSSHFFNSYILRLNTFLLSVIDKGIKELSVVNRGIGCYELPSETFFCPTLEKLELGRCMLSILPPPSTLNHLSNIKNLVLFRVYFTNDQFEQMISCCRLLESLKVDCCIKVRHFRICAPKLSSLVISTLKRIRISLKDVAQLRQATFRFRFEHENTCIQYCDDSSREEDDNQPEKLIKLLMDLSLCHLERLSLHFCTGFAESLQWQSADFPLSLPPQYHMNEVKMLNLEICLSNLQVATVLSCLLNSCPNLHELRIQDKEQHLDTAGNYWESQNPSQCLINYLQIIQISGVNLHRSYSMGFIKFLLMNASVCERITIQYFSDSCSKNLVEQKLNTFQWASPHAVLELKPES